LLPFCLFRKRGDFSFLLGNFLDPILRRFLLLSFHGRSKWRC
jgi:hypothetical protein